MKGATHNLVVRTRTDVALYVLNHKRGHLRDLENSFKVTLAVIADATVSAQQSFIIDRGEQVHTLEAAKALLAAQVAAFPPQVEEAYDEEEIFDVEVESEVETEEAEGVGPKKLRLARKLAAKPMPRVTSASDGGGGAAVPANRVKAAPAPAATAPTPRALRRTRLRSQALPMKPKATKINPRNSPARLAPIRRRTASGGPRRRGRRGGRRRRGGPEDESGRIDLGRNRADIGAGSHQRGGGFRRLFSRTGSARCSARTGGNAAGAASYRSCSARAPASAQSRPWHPAKRKPLRRPKAPLRAAVRPCARR